MSGRSWGQRKRHGRAVIWEKQGRRCCFCARPTQLPERPAGRQADDAATLEHIVPRGAGGSQSLRNCAVSCWKCNNERGDTPFDEFRARKAKGA